MYSASRPASSLPLQTSNFELLFRGLEEASNRPGASKWVADQGIDAINILKKEMQLLRDLNSKKEAELEALANTISLEKCEDFITKGFVDSDRFAAELMEHVLRVWEEFGARTAISLMDHLVQNYKEHKEELKNAFCQLRVDFKIEKESIRFIDVSLLDLLVKFKSPLAITILKIFEKEDQKELITQANSNGCTLLHLAAYVGNMECFDYMLTQFDADEVYAILQDKKLVGSGHTFMHEAIQGDSYQAIKRLKEKLGDEKWMRFLDSGFRAYVISLYRPDAVAIPLKIKTIAYHVLQSLDPTAGHVPTPAGMPVSGGIPIARMQHSAAAPIMQEREDLIRRRSPSPGRELITPFEESTRSERSARLRRNFDNGSPLP
jgi:hypothetical protein